MTISLGTSQGGIEKLKLAYEYGLLSSADTKGLQVDPAKNNGNLVRLTVAPGEGASAIEQNFLYDELNRIKLAREFAVPVPLIFTIAGNGTRGYSGDGGPVFVNRKLSNSDRLKLSKVIIVLPAQRQISLINIDRVTCKF